MVGKTLYYGPLRGGGKVPLKGAAKAITALEEAFKITLGSFTITDAHADALKGLAAAEQEAGIDKGPLYWLAQAQDSFGDISIVVV